MFGQAKFPGKIADDIHIGTRLGEFHGLLLGNGMGRADLER